MTRLMPLSALLAIVALGADAPLVAQERSAITTAELTAAVGKAPSSRAEATRELLSGDQARKLAAAMGVSAEDLADRVGALDGVQLDRLGEQAGVNESLSMRRRDSVVLSTTAIIIILLVLILVTD